MKTLNSCKDFEDDEQIKEHLLEIKRIHEIAD